MFQPRDRADDPKFVEPAEVWQRKRRPDYAGWYVWVSSLTGKKVNIKQTKPQELVSYEELPDEVKEDFDYITGDERFGERFARDYLGNWVDTFEFEIFADKEVRHPFKSWEGSQSDSYFSGLLLMMLSDGNVIIGTYIT